jgi:UDP-glucose 4-epimerase
MLDNKVVLVTGGTGSFGQYTVRELVRRGVEEIRVFSRDEKKQDDMRHEYSDVPGLRFFLGDVRDPESLRRAMRGVDVVFHAAALKQVPSCEYAPMEAVKTNVLGANNVIEAARDAGVERLIAISTDKAVKPVNVMGITKSLQERLIVAAGLDESGPTVACVRYGNVLGSRGSVIPLFRSQIRQGKPVTVTVPEMTRFIITLAQATELIFLAAEQACGGEIFVLKGPSATVIDLAEVLVERLSVNVNVPIEIQGIRPGEKMHEVLVSEEEASRTIDNGDSYVILPQLLSQRTQAAYADRERASLAEYTSANTEILSKAELESILDREGWLTPVSRDEPLA